MEVLAGGGAVAFAQNQRDEVRLVGGDGDCAGAVASSGSSKGQGSPLVCQTVTMASGQANAEIDEGGVSPTLTRLHEAPIVARPSDP